MFQTAPEYPDTDLKVSPPVSGGSFESPCTQHNNSVAPSVNTKRQLNLALTSLLSVLTRISLCCGPD